MFFVSVGEGESEAFSDMVLSSFRQVSWHMSCLDVETHLQQKKQTNKQSLNICKCQALEMLFPNCSTGSFHLQELPGIEQVNSVADISHVSQAYKEVPSLFAYRENYFSQLQKNTGKEAKDQLTITTGVNL